MCTYNIYVTITHTETKFEEVLQSITTAPWYTTNTKLQEYLQSECISCKQVSVFSLYKYKFVSHRTMPFLIHLQLWAHAYRQIFHADINTNNITESINNAMRSRYLKIRPDASVFSLTEALVEVAFPEMEKRYIQATVKQMESYRKSRYPIPEYLLNRPHTVQGECLANQEKAKAITNSMVRSTQQEGVFLVSGNPKHSPKSGYQVDISQGQCSCAYFTLKKIPCKHMFAVFIHFPTWAWCHLPASLTEAPYMTLDETIHSTVDREVTTDDNDAHSDSNEILSPGPVEEPTQPIPVPTTTGNQLYTMQRKARDALAECISLVFCTTELSTLKAINTEAQAMKKVLLSQCSSSASPNDIPAVHLLSRCAVKHARDATKQYA